MIILDCLNKQDRFRNWQSLLLVFALLNLGILYPSQSMAFSESKSDALARININDCKAEFIAQTQSLKIPCVNVQTDNETISYQIILLKQDDDSYILDKAITHRNIVKHECATHYNSETGRLVIPCGDKKDSILRATIPSLPNVFVLESSGIKGSFAASCTHRDYCVTSNPFYPTNGGQCTAYVWGRAYEKTDTAIKFSQNYGRHAYKWYELVKDLPRGREIRSNSIAVFPGISIGSNGHVAFVERVENGIVFFTEANANTYRAGQYGGGYDGYEKNSTVLDFENSNGKVTGYIYLQHHALNVDNLNINPNPLKQYESAKVTATITNTGNTTFNGEIVAALHTNDANRTHYDDIQGFAGVSLSAGESRNFTFQTSNLSVIPNAYQLRINFRPQGSHWDYLKEISVSVTNDSTAQTPVIQGNVDEYGYLHGIDISHHQGSINWGLVADDPDANFAYIKATEGYVTLDQSEAYALSIKALDSKFKQNTNAAIAQGLLTGLYHFARPNLNSTLAGAEKEALHFARFAAPYYSNYAMLPPTLDLETSHSSFTSTQLSNWVKKWLETVHSQLGVKPIIYTFGSYTPELIGLTQYDLWIARYPINNGGFTPPSSLETKYHPNTGNWSDWAIWQYTSQGGGYVNGISGTGLDRNVYDGGLGELQLWAQSHGGLSTPIVTAPDQVPLPVITSPAQSNVFDAGDSVKVVLDSDAPASTWRFYLSTDLLFELSSDGKDCTNCIDNRKTSSPKITYNNLESGHYYVIARAGSDTAQASNWTTPHSFFIRLPTPALNSPANNATLDTTTPSFSWQSIAKSDVARIQIYDSPRFPVNNDDDRECSACILNEQLTRSQLDVSFDLPVGTYYWRVRVGRNASNPSIPHSHWSEVRSFTIPEAAAQPDPYFVWHGNGSIISHHNQLLEESDKNGQDYPHGVTKDVVQLHANDTDKPVGFFQWQIDTNTCPRLGLLSRELADYFPPNMDITVGEWNNRSDDITFSNVKLPFVLGEGNLGDNFNVSTGRWLMMKVAFRDILQKDVKLEAICTSAKETAAEYQADGGEAYVLKDGYQWVGNGSVISHIYRSLSNQRDESLGMDWPFGAFEDTLMVKSSYKPVVFFQWQQDAACPKLEIDTPDDSGYQATVSTKQWNGQQLTVHKDTSLPITVVSEESGSNGDWQLVQVQFHQPVTEEVKITATCQF
ncbi:MAG: GH25 family lysozyme [Thiotrichaceae bacterium]|nr:GH25 family lysozyme [Thiotrichaceae bacterium]